MFLACKIPPLSSPCFINPRPRNLSPARFKAKSLNVECGKSLNVECGKRTGKRRYPSEKKKLEKLQKTLIQTVVTNREEGFWRLYKLTVSLDKDPGKDSFDVSSGLLEAIAKTLEFPVAAMLPKEAFSVVRKSFDARKILKEPKFVYTVDMDAKKLLSLEPRTWEFISALEPKIGLVEYMVEEKTSTDLINMLHGSKKKVVGNSSLMNSSRPVSIKPKVAVVGSGPSGLFAALVLGELGAEVTLIERGKAVEQRGRDIGALVVRRILHSESNFCFGEGGAGTWSDGKLVTRIGKNSDSVQAVMRTLVRFGAPPHILVDGKPHLGTDRLVPLLRNFRNHLKDIGVTVNFDTRLDDLIVKNGQIRGVKVSDASYEPGRDSKDLLFDSVVLAVGHSARDVYQMLVKHNVDMIPKDFAVGLRIEHPQELVNNIQYSTLATKVRDGHGKIPVADYKLVKYVNGGNDIVGHKKDEQIRSCYSFCMCPGGQVVPTSTNPSELCINGMSFSKRSSRWANAALVVTVSSNDFDYSQTQGPLVGVEFQREFERKAAIMGGGKFVVPVQTVTDFLDTRLSATTLPPSSYRLGVKASNLHEIYPTRITEALQQSLMMFDEELPGFITKDALLHGVETRTSSPVQIKRHPETYESTSLSGLYPVGEGAGYAGGIVSAAVDGMYCGFAVAKSLQLYQENEEHVLGKAQRNTGFVKY